MPKSQSNTPDQPMGDAGVSAPAPAMPKGKLGVLVLMLGRPEGARVDELTAATGWQAHSIRGAIAGTVKRKLGMTVSSEKSDKGRVYRIIAQVSA